MNILSPGEFWGLVTGSVLGILVFFVLPALFQAIEDWIDNREKERKVQERRNKELAIARENEEQADKREWETRYANEWRGRTKLIPYGTAEEEKRRVEEFGQRGTIC